MTRRIYLEGGPNHDQKRDVPDDCYAIVVPLSATRQTSYKPTHPLRRLNGREVWRSELPMTDEQRAARMMGVAWESVR
jgi:hypothetical protein